MVWSHNCSPGPQTGPWGRSKCRTVAIMCADLSSLLSGDSEDRELTQAAARVSAALYTCCVCETNVTYLVNSAFYLVLGPDTWSEL